MSGFDPFAPPSGQTSSQSSNNQFDPFNTAPSPAPSNNNFGNSSSTVQPGFPQQSSASGFDDFNTMSSALPPSSGSSGFGVDDGFFGEDFTQNTPQQNPSTTKPTFSSQTSTEFDSIFGASAVDPAPKQQQQQQQQQQGSGRKQMDRRQTNTSFDDFFNSPPQQPSLLQSKRFSVGGTFHATETGASLSSPTNLSAVSDDEVSDDDDDGVMEAADSSMFHAPAPVPPGSTTAGGGRNYEVTFETEKKLGMLLERHDEWVPGNGKVAGKLKECTLVKLVVEHGAADVKGISVGSRVLAVNSHNCAHRPYLETLNLVKITPRPMKIVLQEGKLADDECISGYCLLRKSVGPIPPSVFSTWKRRYFVLGGAVANKNVLQVYKSKQDYEHVVVSLFERRPIAVKLKAYKLTPSFSISAMKSVRYPEVGANVFFFTLMTPGAKLKMIKFGSDNADSIRDLHTHVTRFTGMGR
ncbi:hypothetical protein TrST_g13325 [Triparma strigata]|uniref:PDZ domain-containing protein n=1 Tax=Triparma strigata TaxID=1606541 RepID=A0A9W7DW73_9STRA|nr:hypothetical protein TrST_g13325 [Triparma strigata]